MCSCLMQKLLSSLDQIKLSGFNRRCTVSSFNHYFNDHVILSLVPNTFCCYADKLLKCVLNLNQPRLLLTDTDIDTLLKFKVYFLFYPILYARLKTGGSVIPLGVRPSVCNLFRFRISPPTIFIQ